MAFLVCKMRRMQNREKIIKEQKDYCCRQKVLSFRLLPVCKVRHDKNKIDMFFLAIDLAITFTIG